MVQLRLLSFLIENNSEITFAIEKAQLLRHIPVRKIAKFQIHQYFPAMILIAIDPYLIWKVQLHFYVHSTSREAISHLPYMVWQRLT